VFSAPDPGPTGQPTHTPWAGAPDALGGADDALRSPLRFDAEPTHGAASRHRDGSPDGKRFGPGGGDPFSSPGSDPLSSSGGDASAPTDPYDGHGYESAARWSDPQDWSAAPTDEPRGGGRRRRVEPSGDHAFLDLPGLPESTEPAGDDRPQEWPGSRHSGETLDVSADLFDYPGDEPDHLTDRHDHLAGQPNHLAGPHDLLAGPHDHLAGPPNHLAGQPDHLAGPHGLLAGPHDQLRERPDQLWGQLDDGGRERDHGAADALSRDPHARDPHARDPHARDPHARDSRSRDPLSGGWSDAMVPPDPSTSDSYLPEAFDDLRAPLDDPLTGPLPDHGWSRTGARGSQVSDILPESAAASEVTTGFHALRETDRRTPGEDRPSWGGEDESRWTSHHHEPDYLGDAPSRRGRRSHRREDPGAGLSGDDLVGPATEPMVLLPPVHLTAEPKPAPDEHDRQPGSPSGAHTRSARTNQPAPADWQTERYAETPASSTADLQDHPDDLRPRRRAAGSDLSATALGRPMGSPMAELGAGSSGPSEPIAFADLGDGRASPARGLSTRFSGGQAVRPARSDPSRTNRSERSRRSGHRVRRTRPAGLPSFVAVPVAIVGGLGSAFADLFVTGELGVLFSLGFVLTSFGVAAGIRRADIFTAGVLPPLAALATFAGVGLTMPERLGGTSSPIVAVLSGLATESWTLVAASSFTLGTIALRVAIGRSRSPDLSAEESFGGPAAAQVAVRRSDFRPPF
jgi:hypothetical protein